MKLSQLISHYHSLSFSLNERDIENDPLGSEADEAFMRIERTKPADIDDVAALARLASYVIEQEGDPLGAVPLLENIAGWAQVHGVENPHDLLAFSTQEELLN